MKRKMEATKVVKGDLFLQFRPMHTEQAGKGIDFTWSLLV